LSAFSYQERQRRRTRAPSKTACSQPPGCRSLPPQTRQLIAQSLRGQSFVPTDQLGLVDALSFGGLAVLRRAWDELALGRLFQELSDRRAAGVLAHDKNLLEVEDAFCHLKSYLGARPVFHHRPDRVRNHVRICFLAYWLSAKLEVGWRQKGQTVEVHNLLRQLQCIRLGRLAVGGQALKTVVTQVPKDLNATLDRLGWLPLLSQPPWPSAVKGATVPH